MYYITVEQSPSYHQMTLEELLTQPSPHSYTISKNTSNTRTYETDTISPNMAARFGVDIDQLIDVLKKFNASTEAIRKANMSELYTSFSIPKKSGRGFRRIDAPNDSLKLALTQLKSIFENDFKGLYHTSAFAYIKGRCTIDAVKRHQKNESRWFGKYDLSNFFGSTTIDFVMNQLSIIYPFSEVIKNAEGKIELKKALDIAFLNGGLPQGTPFSPTITNIMMIPIDFKLSKMLRDYNKQASVYTRYADDFIISSKYDFDFRSIEKIIDDVLTEFKAPFKINQTKTRYGSSAGSNWNLGVMLNKDNKITIGYKRKHAFKAMVTNYVLDFLNGNPWDRDQVMYMAGLYSYYKMVEGQEFERQINNHIKNKYNVDLGQMIKREINSL